MKTQKPQPLPKALNFVIRRYFRAFHAFSLEWDLTREQLLAYRTIKTAYIRKIEWFFADVSDLALQEAVRIAHIAMGFATETLPVFWVPSPVNAITNQTSQQCQV